MAKQNYSRTVSCFYPHAHQELVLVLDMEPEVFMYACRYLYVTIKLKHNYLAKVTKLLHSLNVVASLIRCHESALSQSCLGK
jgi:hypothetical protein